MAYNLPPPGADGPDGGFGGGFPGLFPGFGKSFNLDAGAGFGFPGLWGGGGGFPGWTPYVPVTPLGGLWGFKGDLIVPMVAIGVAIFILLLIVLAVKYALAWKLEVLNDIGGGRKFLRSAGDAPAPQLQDDNLNRLADIVSAAVYSEGCSRRILCEIGTYAREGKQYPSLIRLMELVVPEEYHASLMIVRESAEGTFNCEENYPCGDRGQKKQSADAANEIDVTGEHTLGSGITPIAALNATGTSSNSTNATLTTPAPSMFSKFKRSIMK